MAVDPDLQNFVEDVLGSKLQRIRNDVRALLSNIFYSESVLDDSDPRFIALHEKRERLIIARDALTNQILSILPQYFEGKHWVDHGCDPGADVEIYRQLARQGICADTVNISDYR